MSKSTLIRYAFMFAAWALCLVHGGCGGPATSAKTPVAATSPKAEPSAAPAVEKPAVTLEILNYDDLQKRLAQHHGRVVVMDVWSTSCAPCVKEFPHLVELSRKYQGQVSCVSLNVDFFGAAGETAADYEAPALAMLKKWEAHFLNVLASEEADVILQKLELTAPPGVFVYDRAGKLAKRFDNDAAKTEAESFTYAQVESLVKDLLAQPGR